MTSIQNELRVVLMGKTGNGKSSTGNSLLHSRSAFYAKQSAASITRDCQAQVSQCVDRQGRQRRLMVVDTPGFFDTDVSITNQMVERTITSQIFNMTTPGVHAFLIILRALRFTPEEKNTVDFIKTIFGADAAKYCIVIFTCEDMLDEGQSLDDYIRTSPELQEFVRICGNRKLSINNKLSGEFLERKTKQLLQMIDEMVQNNNGTYYTNAEYQRIERQRREEEQRRKQEELARKKAYEEQLVAQARQEEQRRAAEREKKAREEEQQKAQKRIAELEEERRKAEKRQQEERARRNAEEEARLERIRSEMRSTQCSRRSSDDNVGSILGALSQMGLGNPMPQMGLGSPMPQMGLGSPMPQMGFGSPMPSMNTGIRMPFPQSRPASSSMGGGHGGRFTGDFMATTGRANGQPIFEGPRGGLYYINSNGNRSSVRK